MFHKIHRYLNRTTPERPAVLREMEAYASDMDFPIVGPLVGRLLYQLALLTKARNVLELGSGYGYSAYWFSLAVGGKGHITLTDKDRTNKRRAIDYFRRAGLPTQFDFRVGDALAVARKLDGPFDIIFNDVDKELYPKTIDLAADRLRKGGLFLTDNLLCDGRVTERQPDKKARAVMQFTDNLYRDSRFFTTVIPLRDGVAVAMRL